MEPVYTLVKGRAWYCASVFYSRKAWSNLLSEIALFYHNNENLFDYFLVYLSEKQGEHIEITFSSSISNVAVVYEKVNNYFFSFLKNTPSVCSKEFPFGKEFWYYYPNNSLVWNQYSIRYPNMESLLDERLMLCLSEFVNSDQTEDKNQADERNYNLLEQIQQEVFATPSGIGLAQWGCLVECLVQNSFIEVNVDELLAETDEFLITLWEKLADSFVGISQFLLWVGDYFLFRFYDKQSQFRSRSFRMLNQMTLSIEGLFHKPEYSEVYVEPIFLFPGNIWQDLEWWLLRTDESNVCKLTKRILDNLYTLPELKVLLHSSFSKNTLRWQLRNLIGNGFKMKYSY